MPEYYHAHRTDLEKCHGHMTCMRRCPTQAIRIKKGKSVTSEELCIDCGICLSVCPTNAIVPIVDPIDGFSKYKYKIVVPSTVLYSQFDPKIHPYIIHLALKNLGFDQVVDEYQATSQLERAIVKHLDQKPARLPLISSHCPAIVRLIQVRYPSLVELIVPTNVPGELAAKEGKRDAIAEFGLEMQDIGIFYIAPCPAKIVSIKQPAENVKSWFNGALSIQDIFPLLLSQVKVIAKTFNESQVPADFYFSTAWSALGSIGRKTGMENWLSVSGLDHVNKIFDDIENSRLRNVEFVEAMSCMLGCIGGPFIVENPYIVRSNNNIQNDKYTRSIPIDMDQFQRKYNDGYHFMEQPILPRPMKFFDTDLVTSIKRMKEKERIYSKLPQIDCGCCGSPTCMVFSEDVVKGDVKITDCIFFSVPEKRE